MQAHLPPCGISSLAHRLSQFPKRWFQALRCPRGRRRASLHAGPAAIGRYQIQSLEERCLLDASFVLQQIGMSENTALVQDSVINKQGDVFFSESTSDERAMNLRVTRQTPTATGPAVTSTLVSDVEGLQDFDASGDSDGPITYIHYPPTNIGRVVTAVGSSQKQEHLMIDVRQPTAFVSSVSFPRPSLGASAFKFKVNFADGDTFINLERRFDGEELQLRGPNGAIELIPYNVQSYWGDSVVVEYAAAPADGTWSPNDNGAYVLSTVKDVIRDVAGNGIEQKTLAAFSLNWDIDAEYSRFDVNIPAFRVSHFQREGHDFVRDNDFTFASRAAFEQLVDNNISGYSLGLNHVSISETGIIAVAGNLGDYPLIVRWDRLSDTVTGTLLSTGIGKITDIDVADNGAAAVLVDDLAMHLPAGLNFAVPITQLHYSDGTVRISPDGTKVVFQRLDKRTPQWSFSVFVYDSNTCSIDRVIGSDFDGELDPGERWDYSDGTLRNDVSAYLHDHVAVIGISQSGVRDYYVMYASVGFWESESDRIASSVRVFTRKMTYSESAGIVAGTPILLGAIQADYASSSHHTTQYARTFWAATFNATTREFHTLVSWVPAVSNGTAIVERHRSRGRLPQFNPNHWSNERTRHADLEIIAREIAYWDLRDPQGMYQVGTILENGYIIEGMYLHENPNAVGFAAVSLLPFDSNGAGTPVIAFRGTDKILSEHTNLDAEGVGYSQFINTQPWIMEWIRQNDSLYSAGVTLTGHSLGGALTQWFAASIITSTQFTVAEVVTFNSPGINARTVAEAERISDMATVGVTHYVVSGDVVSLAGEAFLQGTVRVIQVSDSVPFLWDMSSWGFFDLAPRHGRPYLNPSLRTDSDDVIPELEQSQPRKEYSNTDVLNHPEFNFLSDPAYVRFLFGISSIIGRNADYFVSRQRTELARRHSQLDLGTAVSFVELTGAQSVFVSLDVEKALRYVPRPLVRYNYTRHTLITTVSAPLIAVTEATFGGDLRVRGGDRHWIYSPRNYRVIDISSSNRNPGTYVAEMSVGLRARFVLEADGTQVPTNRLSWSPRRNAETYELWVDNVTTEQRQIVRVPGISSTEFGLPQLADGRYRYWVQFEDATGAGRWSKPDEFQIQGGSMIEADTAGTLSWTPFRSAFSYEVWIDNRTTGQAAVLSESGLIDPEFRLPSLPDGEYDYWIQFEGADGHGPWSSRQTIRIADGRIISTHNQSAGNIVWQPDRAAATYELWINNVSTRQQKVVHVAGLPLNRFELPQLPDGTYRYWIQYEGTDRNGRWSKPTEFVVSSGKATLRASSGTLSWSGFESAVRYELWIDNRTTGQRAVVHETELTGTSFWLPEMNDGDYSYWLRVHTAKGPLKWSTRVDFRVAGKVRTSADLNSPGSITWTPTTTAASYEIWVSHGSGPTTRIAGVAGLVASSFELPSLNDGEYRYWVRRLDAFGNGGWEGVQRFRIINGHLSSDRMNELIVWNPVPSARTYEIWVDNRTTNQSAVIRLSHIETNWFELPVLPDGTYEYWVRSTTHTATSKWSPPGRFRVSNGRIQSWG